MEKKGQLIKEFLLGVSTETYTPLFMSVKDLVEQLCHHHPSYTNFKSLQTTLSAIFGGRRDLSKKIALEIRVLVKEKINSLSPQDANSVLNKFDDICFAPNSATNPQASDDLEFKEMLRIAKKAQEHFIVTFRSAESDSAPKQAQTLNDLLLERLGIVPFEPDCENKPFYRFIFPKGEVASDFKSSLLRLALQKSFNGKSSIEFLTDEESTNWQKMIEPHIQTLYTERHIQVYLIDGAYCVPPIVAYDPSSASNLECYSFAYHRNDELDVVRWGRSNTNDWSEAMYKRFPYDKFGNQNKNQHITDKINAIFLKYEEI